MRKTQRSKPVKSFGQRYVVGNPLVGGEYQSVCAEYENLASLLPLFASVFVETSARALRLSLAVGSVPGTRVDNALARLLSIGSAYCVTRVCFYEQRHLSAACSLAPQNEQRTTQQLAGWRSVVYRGDRAAVSRRSRHAVNVGTPRGLFLPGLRA